MRFISMYDVLIQFQNIHTFTYQKTLLHTFLPKIVERLQCIHKSNFVIEVLKKY